MSKGAKEEFLISFKATWHIATVGSVSAIGDNRWWCERDGSCICLVNEVDSAVSLVKAAPFLAAAGKGHVK